LNVVPRSASTDAALTLTVWLFGPAVSSSCAVTSCAAHPALGATQTRRSAGRFFTIGPFNVIGAWPSFIKLICTPW
jgi:hypothetical protein